MSEGRKHLGQGVTVARMNLWKCWCGATWLQDPTNPYSRSKCPERPRKKRK